MVKLAVKKPKKVARFIEETNEICLIQDREEVRITPGYLYSMTQETQAYYYTNYLILRKYIHYYHKL